ncbi:tRNA (adenosine(37)-N6)-threonylcarbamoyltransferase complex ATPase subunit type 1 TsaE [Allofustis seminis]|uniref:tRNA (adenosine(37)-N6)-threonylcarbamoyltransferase complex ATPase subunit type 1 TsaE n=1 Tax=Allofustis seminis TaxID=166939 RepID=UPI000368C0A3|nr:tRNA (adenosine(37)-N6)-threonylcarbamoyltransferase complex ATPase subunit type 1 TsaE [Allofustis seminis]
MPTIHIESLDETATLAQTLAQLLTPYSVICLEGTLGAGKTTFTQSLAAGLGIRRAVKSPSYTLVREYEEGRLPLYHIDLYRLEEAAVEDLYLEDYYESPGVTVIEWGSNAPEELPKEHLLIEIKTFAEQPTVREFIFQAKGNKYERLIQQLIDEYLKHKKGE